MAMVVSTLLKKAVTPPILSDWALDNTLRAYAMACGNLASLSKAADFVKGFRLGAQVILAVLLLDGPQQPSMDKPLEQQATTRPLTAFL